MSSTFNRLAALLPTTQVAVGPAWPGLRVGWQGSFDTAGDLIGGGCLGDRADQPLDEIVLKSPNRMTLSTPPGEAFMAA